MLYLTVFLLLHSLIRPLKLSDPVREDFLTPLKLYLLIELSESHGQTLFGSLDYENSRAALNHLLRMRTIEFNHYISNGCSGMDKTRFQEFRGSIVDERHIKVNCLDRLPFLYIGGPDIVKGLPSLKIDTVLTSKKWSDPALKLLFQQTINDVSLRSSVPVCKTFAEFHDTLSAEDFPSIWRISDAFCLMSAPKLAESFLPDVYDVNLTSNSILRSMDRLLHVMATCLTIMRMEVRKDLSLAILTTVSTRKLRMRQEFEEFSADTSDLSAIHYILGNNLRHMVCLYLHYEHYPDILLSIQDLLIPLQNVWVQIADVHQSQYHISICAIRQNILMILFEVTPLQNIHLLAGMLEELLSCKFLQERIVCLLIDILRSRDFGGETLPLLQVLYSKIKKDYGRPFKCRRPTGFGHFYPIEEDAKIIARRRSLTSIVDYLKGSSRLFERIDLDCLRQRACRKLSKLISSEAIAVKNSSDSTPRLLLKLESHPYKIQQFWDNLLLSSSLRIRLPFSIHPDQSQVFVVGDTTSRRKLYNTLTSLQFGPQTSQESQLTSAQKIRSFGIFNTLSFRYHGSTKKGYMYYMHANMNKQNAKIQNLEKILVNFQGFWHRNQVYVEIDEIAFLFSEIPRVYTDYLVNPTV